MTVVLAASFRAVNHHVLDLPLLGNRVVVGRLVALVICLQFLVGGMQSLENVGLRDHRIFELHFGVALVEFVANFGVTHEGAARNQGAQLAYQDVSPFPAPQTEEPSCRVRWSRVFILFLPNELAVGKEAWRPVAHAAAHRAVRRR